MASVRRQLLRALCWSSASVCLAAAVAMLWQGYEIATAVLLGGIIVLAPNGWMALRVARLEGHRVASQLALAKFALCGLGFALLFALKPDISAPAALCGAGLALVALPTYMVLDQQKTQR